MKNKRTEIIVITLLMIIQTAILIFAGTWKQYLHIDEAYSYGLSSYDKVEFSDNEDFFNNWHDKNYYEDYLSLQDDEKGEYKQVYDNQKNDVHPPLYYLILRFAMNFTKGHFSMWSGIGINIIIYVFITIFTYLVLQKMLSKEEYAKEKSIILAFVSSITMASLSNVTYIRMYVLLTLEVLITLYLHIKLLEKKEIDKKLLLAIGLSVLAGILTHYYYLFYIVVLYIIFAVKYIREKDYKKLIYYTLTMLLSGITSLIIFPYSINHMFFGYRGQGVLENFVHPPNLIKKILENVVNIDYYGFHKMFYAILIINLLIFILNKMLKKGKIDEDKKHKQIMKIINIPVLIYFLIVSIASPWNVLRYTSPVCGLIFIIVIYYFYELLKLLLGEKKSSILTLILLVAILISPLIYKIKPELVYTEKKEIVQELEKKQDLNMLYIYNPDKCNFLDDILLFTKINESYITKDISYTKEKIEEIFKEKDTSKGIIILLNEADTEKLEMIKETLNLKSTDHLEKLNTCDVYYIY